VSIRLESTQKEEFCFRNFQTNFAKISCLRTPSNLFFIIVGELKSKAAEELLRKIYKEIYV
jgi:hypothetical protein